MSKEKSMEEIREEFLEHVRDLIEYWDEAEKSTNKEKLSGLAFSILVALDGGAADLPGFLVAPLVSLEDVDSSKEENEDYYPYNSGESIKCDIAGSLHELFYKK